MVTRSQYVASMQLWEPEKEQPTLVTMATHLLGVLSRLILPETLVPGFDWTQRCFSDASGLVSILLQFSPLDSDLTVLFCWAPFLLCVRVFVVTCVFVRLISRTRKAVLPSSLWHVTVKSP